MTVRREVARDMREERDSRDVRALSLLVALPRPVSPESGMAITAEVLMNNAG